MKTASISLATLDAATLDLATGGCKLVEVPPPSMTTTGNPMSVFGGLMATPDIASSPAAPLINDLFDMADSAGAGMWGDDHRCGTDTGAPATETAITSDQEAQLWIPPSSETATLMVAPPSANEAQLMVSPTYASEAQLMVPASSETDLVLPLPHPMPEAGRATEVEVRDQRGDATPPPLAHVSNPGPASENVRDHRR